MTGGHFSFRPALWPTLVVSVLVPAFVALGLWQLRRADESEALAAAVAERSHLEPLVLGAGLAPDLDLRYRRVVVRGEYEPEQQVFLDNRTHDGRLGFQVVTPLRIAGSAERVLINRGWVAADLRGGTLPAVDTPAGPVEVHGSIDFPSPPRFTLGAAGRPGPAWGRRWPYLSLAYFAEQTGYGIEPFVVLQDPNDASGFVREWPQVASKRDMHLGYAAQWFAFAGIAVAVYLGLSVSRRGAGEQAA